MIYFIGAGPGAKDLITVRGAMLLARAQLVVYAGSLVNPELLSYCPPETAVLNSASMTLEEIIEAMAALPREAVVVRLHTGDPCLYGAIREQMDRLDALGYDYEVVPGVSAFCAAAAALRTEYTPADRSQTVIISRRKGRTAVPESERVPALAAHGATMVFFLSVGMLPDLCRELIEGGYSADTPAAVVYKATWPEEEIVRGTLKELPGRAAHIESTALVVVGDFLKAANTRSKLYDPAVAHRFREARR